MLRLEDLTPSPDGPVRLGDQAGAVDHEQRAALNADISRILKMPGELRGHFPVVIWAVVLGDQHLAFGAVPSPRPVLVCPHEGERHIDAAIVQEPFERPVQQALAIEPVIVEDEPVDAGGARHRHLLAHRFDGIEAVEPEIAWDTGLVVTLKSRNAAGDVSPLGETFAPPRIVLRDGVELGQVVGKQFELTASADGGSGRKFSKSGAGLVNRFTSRQTVTSSFGIRPNTPGSCLWAR